MKQPRNLHPFLLPILPVLFLYAYNNQELSLADLWGPLALTLAGAGMLWGLLALVLRDRGRAGLLTSLFCLWFFSWSRLYSLVPDSYDAPSIRSCFTIYLLLIAGAAGFIIYQKRGRNTLTVALNLMALGLVALQLTSIGRFELRRSLTAAKIKPATEVKLAATSPTAQFPNIYFIVLDGYARADTLQQIYHYDNRPFLQALAQRGFQVIPQSRANYGQTPFSIASTLNFKYLDQLAREVGTDSSDRMPLTTMIQNSRLFSILRKQHYQISTFPSGYTMIELHEPEVHVFKPKGKTIPVEFDTLLLKTTVTALFVNMTPSRREPTLSPWLRPLYTFDHLQEANQLTPPFFVYAHILLPHPPFIFDRNGELLVHPIKGRVHGTYKGIDLAHNDAGKFPGTREEYINGYREQLIYTNNCTLKALDRVLASSHRPTLIVLISDHGPASQFVKAEQGNPRGMKERFANFISYRLPDGGTLTAADELSSVNIFRLVLNRYFNTQLQLLPDKSYASSWEKPYLFTDVTAIATGRAKDSRRK